MKILKFPLAVLVELCLVLFPSSCIIAQNRTVSTHHDQSTQTYYNPSASSARSSQPKQEPQPTRSVTATKIKNNSTAAIQVFLPTVINPELSYYVSPSGSNSNPGTFNKPWRTKFRKRRIRWWRGIQSRSSPVSTMRNSHRRTRGAQRPILPTPQIRERWF